MQGNASDLMDRIALKKFAIDVKFPAHALIVRPVSLKGPIFKGLHSEQALEEAFNQYLKYSEK